MHGGKACQWHQCARFATQIYLAQIGFILLPRVRILQNYLIAVAAGENRRYLAVAKGTVQRSSDILNLHPGFIRAITIDIHNCLQTF